MHRRFLLAALPAAALGHAGCLSVFDGDDANVDHPTLGKLWFQFGAFADDVDAVELTVRIRSNEELVHEGTYTVERRSERLVYATEIVPEHVPEPAVPWEVAAKVEDGEWHTTSSASMPQAAECVQVIGAIGGTESRLFVGWYVGSGEC